MFDDVSDSAFKFANDPKMGWQEQLQLLKMDDVAGDALLRLPPSRSVA